MLRFSGAKPSLVLEPPCCRTASIDGKGQGEAPEGEKTWRVRLVLVL